MVPALDAFESVRWYGRLHASLARQPAAAQLHVRDSKAAQIATKAHMAVMQSARVEVKEKELP